MQQQPTPYSAQLRGLQITVWVLALALMLNSAALIVDVVGRQQLVHQATGQQEQIARLRRVVAALEAAQGQKQPQPQPQGSQP